VPACRSSTPGPGQALVEKGANSRRRTVGDGDAGVLGDFDGRPAVVRDGLVGEEAEAVALVLQRRLV